MTQHANLKTMRLTVVFFANLKQEIGLDKFVFETAEQTTVREIAQQIEQQQNIKLKGAMVAVNEHYATPDQILQDGDEVAFLPPVAGGSPLSEQKKPDNNTFSEVTSTPLQLEQADAFLVQPWCGAQAYFVGTVRSPNQGKKVHFIDYEAYPSMANKIMQDAANHAREKFGHLRIFIQHRTGRLLPAEASILIGVASPHRRAALEACDFLIEYLKIHIPVWKNEQDEDGQKWVDGSTPHQTL